MWIVRWVVMVIIILSVLAFILQNQEPDVVLNLYGLSMGPVPLYMALFVSFSIGMIAMLLLTIFQHLQIISDLSREQRAHKRTKILLEEARADILEAKKETRKVRQAVEQLEMKEETSNLENVTETTVELETSNQQVEE